MATLPLIGIYNYNEHIFDGLTFPEGIDKEIAVNEILTRSGEFEILYPDDAFLTAMITHWGKKHYRTFDKWVKALAIEYKPLENFDRNEETRDETRKNSGYKTSADYTDKRTANLEDKRTADLNEKTTYLNDEPRYRSERIPARQQPVHERQHRLDERRSPRRGIRLRHHPVPEVGRKAGRLLHER